MSIGSRLILEHDTVTEASSLGGPFQAGMRGLSLQSQLFLDMMNWMVLIIVFEL